MANFLIIMHESATNEQHNGVIEAVQAQEGRVEVRLFPRVVIGQARQDSRDLEATLRDQAGVSTVYTTPARDVERLELDTTSLAAVRAWNLRQTPEYRSAKEARRETKISLDFGRYRGDIIPVEKFETRSLPPSCQNTSRYMLGTVAVGIIIVNGPGQAAFVSNEIDLINAGVDEGMRILTDLAPVDPGGIPRLSFIKDLHQVDLSLTPTAVASEIAWRDPAMAVLGYSGGKPGLYDYLHDLRTIRWPICPGPDWAYVAFFTKYWTGYGNSTNYPGYADLGGPRLVIPYDFVPNGSGRSGAYRPTDIYYLFAHETGHIFGAPDESQATSTCPPPYPNQYGYLGEPNGNCEATIASPTPCLMWLLDTRICQHTVAQFGWRDSDNNNLPDPIDPASRYGTDVGIIPSAVFWNNPDLWIRNQDDGEANQSSQIPVNNTDNFIYARVKNFGGVKAEIVRVAFYLANFTGTEFVYPTDYTNKIDAPDTPCPTLFCLEPGDSAIAKVRLRPSQLPPSTWHPCLLVHVSCAQDSSVAAGSHVWDSNNLAQKNYAVDCMAPGQTHGLTVMAQNASAGPPFFEFKRERAHDAAKVTLQFRDLHFRPEVIEPADVTTVERGGRLFLTLASDRSTTFRLPLRPRTRKTVGLGFTVPTDARIGDEYQFELIQSNEHRQPTGGITFIIRVVKPQRVLSEQRWRTSVLRELGQHLKNPRFDDLADAADALIENQFDQDGESLGDPTAARGTFSRLLREIAVPEVWGYPVEALIDMDKRRPGLVEDLDALSLILFYAQERLLVKHETRQ
jgi:hypothetical protein